MKKLLSILLSVVLVICIYSLIVSNQNNSIDIVSETIEYFDDGSSVTTIILGGLSPENSGPTYVKKGSKTQIVKSAEGDVLWKFTVKGTFSVNPGVDATCTESSYSVSGFSKGWSLKTATALNRDNSAVADGVLQHKVLFIITNKQESHITLQCDSNGKLS